MALRTQPGDILLGKYRVENTLGKGGMGIVVAVRHVHLGELFAIKMLLTAAQKSDGATERFLREARASAKLKGEHVARVHDVGSLDDGAPYMVMEYLVGDDLKQILKRQGPFPLNELALFVHQACEAVGEAHALGIVHRDLKPANLFLTRRPNGTPCIKVLDFGISKELDPDGGSMSDLTKTGTFIGSPPYMSPEQMSDIKATDRRSDIWSLGVILYELATGQLPFQGQGPTELIARILTSEPVLPSRLCPDIPLEFDAVVRRCLEKRPENRYQTPADLAADLVPLITGSLSGLLGGPTALSSSPGMVAPAVTTGPAADSTGPRAPMRSSVTGSGVLPKASANPSPVESSPGARDAASEPLQRDQTPAATVNDDSVANRPTKITTGNSARESAPNAMQNGQTDGAWGTTSNASSRKDHKALILIAALLTGGVLAVLLFMYAKPAGSAAENTAEILPTSFGKPTAVVGAPATESITQPAPLVTPSSPILTAEPSAATTTRVAAPGAAKSSNTPATTKPATSVKSSVAGFND
jgi:serine/threonine-protein kinase